MLLAWYNKEHKKRLVNISYIGDIECIENNGVFYLRIKKDNVLLGGELASFKSMNSCEKALSAIKEAIDANCEEFEFRPNFFKLEGKS